MCLRILHTILFFSIAFCSFSGNPLIRGTWKGYMISNSLSSDVDNKDGLPVTLYIIDDNDKGDLVGEMTVRYKYQTDIYRAKWHVSGNLDYANYTISIQQNNFIYFDLLPKGLDWCTGGGTFNIYRSNYKKKLYMDGNMLTSCGDERIRMVLVKQ
jgi:hypothetical protein